MGLRRWAAEAGRRGRSIRRLRLRGGGGVFRGFLCTGAPLLSLGANRQLFGLFHKSLDRATPRLGEGVHRGGQPGDGCILKSARSAANAALGPHAPQVRGLQGLGEPWQWRRA